DTGAEPPSAPGPAPGLRPRPACPGGTLFDNQNAQGLHPPFSAPARLVRAERCLNTGTGAEGLGAGAQTASRPDKPGGGGGGWRFRLLVSKQRSARTSRAGAGLLPGVFWLSNRAPPG